MSGIYLLKKHPIKQEYTEAKIHFHSLPNEVIKLIFRQVMAVVSEASFCDLKKCALVCKNWKELATEVQRELLTAKAKSLTQEAKELWESHFGTINQLPPLPDNIVQILRGPCPFWPNKKVKDTHMLVMIPKTVNGNPLKLEYMEQLIQSPKQGFKTKFDNSYFNNHEKTAVNQSHWILMTQDVIPDSRCKSYSDHLKQVATCNQNSKTSYELVHLIDAVVAILLEHVQTGTRLYSDNPYNYTHCQEKGSLGQMIVGGFSLSGLSVYNFVSNVHNNLGLGLFRKF